VRENRKLGREGRKGLLLPSNKGKEEAGSRLLAQLHRRPLGQGGRPGGRPGARRALARRAGRATSLRFYPHLPSPFSSTSHPSLARSSPTPLWGSEAARKASPVEPPSLQGQAAPVFVYNDQLSEERRERARFYAAI